MKTSFLFLFCRLFLNLYKKKYYYSIDITSRGCRKKKKKKKAFLGALSSSTAK